MAVGFRMDGFVVMCYISTWQKQLVSIANESYIFVAMKFTAKNFSIFHKEDLLYSIRFFFIFDFKDSLNIFENSLKISG